MTTPINTTDRNVVVKVVDLHKTFGTLEVLKGISLDLHCLELADLGKLLYSGASIILNSLHQEKPTLTGDH